jgi:hypothetical protein
VAISPAGRDRPASFKRIAASTFIERKGAGENAFRACVLFGRGKPAGSRRDVPLLHLGKHTTCAYGRNPRIAFARAFRLMAGEVEKRAGAFAGMRRR